MIHGRFQPFHAGHLAYLPAAAERSDELFVGITDPDRRAARPEPADPLRHLPESNPFTYTERLMMIAAAAGEAGIAVRIVPFPITEPESWIGRDPGGRVVLNDPTVDPRHARVFRDPKRRWVIANSGSVNGVWARVEEIALERGGQFQCGEQRFIIKVL